MIRTKNMIPPGEILPERNQDDSQTGTGMKGVVIKKEIPAIGNLPRGKTSKNNKLVDYTLFEE